MLFCHIDSHSKDGFSERPHRLATSPRGKPGTPRQTSGCPSRWRGPSPPPRQWNLGEPYAGARECTAFFGVFWCPQSQKPEGKRWEMMGNGSMRLKIGSWLNHVEASTTSNFMGLHLGFEMIRSSRNSGDGL